MKLWAIEFPARLLPLIIKLDQTRGDVENSGSREGRLIEHDAEGRRGFECLGKSGDPRV